MSVTLTFRFEILFSMIVCIVKLNLNKMPKTAAIKNIHSLSGSGTLAQINTLLPLFMFGPWCFCSRWASASNVTTIKAQNVLL